MACVCREKEIEKKIVTQKRWAADIGGRERSELECWMAEALTQRWHRPRALSLPKCSERDSWREKKDILGVGDISLKFIVSNNDESINKQTNRNKGLLIQIEISRIISQFMVPEEFQEL